MTQPCKECEVHQATIERLVIVEQSTKSAHHRLDSLEKHTESIVRLSMSVEHLTEAIAENVIPNQEAHERRLVEVENRPGAVALSWWRRVLIIVVTAFLTGLIGFGLGVILKTEESKPKEEEVGVVCKLKEPELHKVAVVKNMIHPTSIRPQVIKM